MEITNFSRIRILSTMSKWELPRDYIDPLYNYLVYGWNPGGFFSRFLANDCWAALASSHTGNQIDDLKRLAGWIQADIPEEASGSMENVNTWIKMSDKERRKILERRGLVYTETEEIVIALDDKRYPNTEPLFY